MLLTLEEIKQQCRLESDFTEEDQLLELFALAAEAKAVTYLNRNLYKRWQILHRLIPMAW